VVVDLGTRAGKSAAERNNTLSHQGEVGYFISIRATAAGKTHVPLCVGLGAVMSAENKRSQANIDDILYSIREIIADGDPGVMSRKQSGSPQPDQRSMPHANVAPSARPVSGPQPPSGVAPAMDHTDSAEDDEDDAILDLSEDFIVAPAEDEKWSDGFQMPIPGDGPAELVDTVFPSHSHDDGQVRSDTHAGNGFEDRERADPWAVEDHDEPASNAFDVTETYKLARSADRPEKAAFWSHRPADAAPQTPHVSAEADIPAPRHPAADEDRGWPDDEEPDGWVLSSRAEPRSDKPLTQSPDGFSHASGDDEIIIEDDMAEADHSAEDVETEDVHYDTAGSGSRNDAPEWGVRPPAGFVQPRAQAQATSRANEDPAAEIEAAFGRRPGARSNDASFYAYEPQADMTDYRHTAETATPRLPEPSAAPATGPARSLEDSVKDMLRPMLAEWLNRNMPTIVEKAVREELATQRSQPDSTRPEDD
jgi:cell pole-organizing protein PopZ